MMSSRVISLLIALSVCSACIPARPKNAQKFVNTQSSTQKAPNTNSHDTQSRSEVAQVGNGDIIINYIGYTVSYSPAYRIPNWVTYDLTRDKLSTVDALPSVDFEQDPNLRAAQADGSDYRGSGWSRGHMVPKADLKWNRQAYIESYYYTNCCPQLARLNSGSWNQLEQRVRGWAKQFGKVTIVCGPLIGQNKNGRIGQNRVVVPDAFFKALLYERNGNYYGIAFVMFNDDNTYKLRDCALTIDEVEELSGYDFFSYLKDSIESSVEATFSFQDWNIY